MKKNSAKTLIGITLGITMLVSTAFTMGNPNKGYDLYKEALKKMTDTSSVTASMNIQAFDNGKELMEGNLVGKFDVENKLANASGKLEANNVSKDVTFYREEDKEYFQFGEDDTIYQRAYVEDSEQRRSKRFQKDEDISKKSEMSEKIADVIMGDFKKQFIVTNKDNNTQVITFKLSKNEFPEILKLALAAKFNGEKREDSKMKDMNHPLAQQFIDMGIMEMRPNLVEEVTLETFEIQAEIENACIKSQTINIEISGKDDKGELHNLRFTADFDLSNVNETLVDKVDLSEKNVQVVNN